MTLTFSGVTPESLRAMLTWPSSWTIKETTPPMPPNSATAARAGGVDRPLETTNNSAKTPTGTNAPLENTIGTGHWTTTKLLFRGTWAGAIPNTTTASTPEQVFFKKQGQVSPEVGHLKGIFGPPRTTSAPLSLELAPRD